MLLTADQFAEIGQIIRDHHSAFIANTIGASALPDDVKKRLAQKGMLDVKVEGIEDAYLYGQLLAMMDDPKYASMSYDEFKRHIRKNPIPLSDIEQRAVEMAKQHAANYVQGLGNRIDQQTGEVLIEADAALRRKLQTEIRTITEEGIARRKSVKQIKSDLGWMSDDWARDWDRIAITEKQMAMQQGVADHYRDRYGPEVRVAKIPMPDACQHCKRLHLGPDGHPRVFPLSVLEANGINNYGRKARDWKAVVGAIHPRCQCQLVRVPAGWGFNENGSLVPGGEGGTVYRDDAAFERAVRREDDLKKSLERGGDYLWNGLDLFIENPPGSTRHWHEEQTGASGQTYMVYGYGYLKRTCGADEDEVDVFVGPDPDSQAVYVIHQKNPKSGTYDEDKVMLGFTSREQAENAYRIHYDDPDYLWTVSEMRLDHFRRWALGSNIESGTMLKSGMSPKSGTPLKSGTRDEVFVLPEDLVLRKATASTSPAGESRAHHHAPGPGIGMNVAIENMRPSHQVDPDPENLEPKPREIYEGLHELEDVIIRRSPEQYRIAPRVEGHTYHVERTELQDGMLQLTPEELEQQKDWVRVVNQRRLGAVKNHVDPEADGTRADYYDGEGEDNEHDD